MRDLYVSAKEAALILGVHRNTVPSLIRRGLLRGELMAGRWLLERSVVEELATTYVAKPGRPRMRRRTKKSKEVQREGLHQEAEQG